MSKTEVTRDSYFGAKLMCPTCNTERSEQKVFIARSSVWALVCECPRPKG